MALDPNAMIKVLLKHPRPEVIKRHDPRTGDLRPALDLHIEKLIDDALDDELAGER